MIIYIYILILIINNKHLNHLYLPLEPKTSHLLPYKTRDNIFFISIPSHPKHETEI